MSLVTTTTYFSTDPFDSSTGTVSLLPKSNLVDSGGTGSSYNANAATAVVAGNPSNDPGTYAAIFTLYDFNNLATTGSVKSTALTLKACGVSAVTGSYSWRVNVTFLKRSGSTGSFSYTQVAGTSTWTGTYTTAQGGDIVVYADTAVGGSIYTMGAADWAAALNTSTGSPNTSYYIAVYFENTSRNGTNSQTFTLGGLQLDVTYDVPYTSSALGGDLALLGVGA